MTEDRPDTPAELRARGDDRMLLFAAFVDEARAELDRPEAMVGAVDRTTLLASDWPGNVREMRQFAFAAIPGEPFVQHQLDLRAKCAAVPNVFILGLAYSGRGSPFVVYIPTAQAVKEGGYGATECSFVAPDAGARMVEELAKLLR